MAPLIVMIVSWLIARAAGAAGAWPAADSWATALRVALAVMFIFTAISHFHPRTRPDLVRMVPPFFPAPGAMVTLTGVFELLGAIGLLVPATRTAAAYGLILLLLGMFPANVYAARASLMVLGRKASALIWRLPLQVFWIGALWWVAR
jgi:uncharacterized membrane protein